MLPQTTPRPAPAGIRIEVVRDPDAFAALRAEWGELLDDSGAGLFNAWEWLYPWHRRLAPERALRILAARGSDGRLLGLMPLAVERRRVLGRTVRRLAFLGETHVGSDYLDVIARRRFREPVIRAFAEWLRDASADWDVLDLPDLESRSLTVEVLGEVFGEGRFRVRVTPREQCPCEALPAVGFAEFLKTRSRADNYLRRRKWLEAQPGFGIDVAAAPRELAGPMDDFFRLHALRWQEEGGSAGIADAATEAFHRQAMPLLAERGALRLFTLRLDGRALASVYGLRHGDSFLYYQAGYDPAWRSRSVGLVLVGETFRYSLAAGLAEFDFLRGLEPYKGDWTTGFKYTVGLRVFRPFGVGAWLDHGERLAAATKRLVKRVIPAEWLARLRGRG